MVHKCTDKWGTLDGIPMHWQVRYTWWYTNAMTSEVHLIVHQCTDKWSTLDGTPMHYQVRYTWWCTNALPSEVHLMVYQCTDKWGPPDSTPRTNKWGTLRTDRWGILYGTTNAPTSVVPMMVPSTTDKLGAIEIPLMVPQGLMSEVPQGLWQIRLTKSQSICCTQFLKLFFKFI